jgi:hypothetical protein
MSLSSLLLAIWLILVGLAWLGWVTISTRFLGGWALVTGIVWLLESWHPITLPVRRNAA